MKFVTKVCYGTSLLPYDSIGYKMKLIRSDLLLNAPISSRLFSWSHLFPFPNTR